MFNLFIKNGHLMPPTLKKLVWNCTLQTWHFTYRMHTVGIWNPDYFEWSKRGWFANGLDFKWDLKSGSPTIWNPDKSLERRTLNCAVDSNMCGFWMVDGFQMVGTIAIAKALPFENWNIWNLSFKMSWFKMFMDFRWSDFRYPLYQF